VQTPKQGPEWLRLSVALPVWPGPACSPALISLSLRPASRSRVALAARAQSSGETQEGPSAASRRSILAASLLAAAGTQLVDLAAAPLVSAIVPTTAVPGRIWPLFLTRY